MSGAASKISQIMELLKRGRPREALRLAKSAAAKFPDEPLLYGQIASCYSDLRDHQQALVELVKAQHLFPDNHIIESSIACVYQRLKRYDLQEEYVRAALSHTPANFHLLKSAYLNTLGECLWRRGSGIEAVDAWRKAVEEYPANKEAKWNLVKHPIPGQN